MIRSVFVWETERVARAGEGSATIDRDARRGWFVRLVLWVDGARYRTFYPVPLHANTDALRRAFVERLLGVYGFTFDRSDAMKSTRPTDEMVAAEAARHFALERRLALPASKHSDDGTNAREHILDSLNLLRRVVRRYLDTP